MQGELGTGLLWQMNQYLPEVRPREKTAEQDLEKVKWKGARFGDQAFPLRCGVNPWELLAFYLHRKMNIPLDAKVLIGRQGCHTFMRLPDGKIYAEKDGLIREVLESWRQES